LTIRRIIRFLNLIPAMKLLSQTVLSPKAAILQYRFGSGAILKSQSGFRRPTPGPGTSATTAPGHLGSLVESFLSATLF
jgi:hypothetical protein